MAEQSHDAWLEDQIQERFPDNLNIPVGQLRVRIATLCFEYEKRLLNLEPIALKTRELWKEPFFQKAVIDAANRIKIRHKLL